MMPIDTFVYQQLLQIVFNPIIAGSIITMFVGALMLMAFPRANLIFSAAMISFSIFMMYMAFKYSMSYQNAGTLMSLVGLALLIVVGMTIWRFITTTISK